MTESALRAANSSGPSGEAVLGKALVTYIAHSVIPIVLLWLLGYGGSGLAVFLLQSKLELPAVVEASLRLPGWISSLGLIPFGLAVAAALVVDVGAYSWLRLKLGETTSLAWAYFILIVEGAFVGWMGVCYTWGVHSLIRSLG